MSTQRTCLCCSGPILIAAGYPPAELARRVFCSRTCAARHNNRANPKRKRLPSITAPCRECGTPMVLRRRPSGHGFEGRRLCDTCRTQPLVSRSKAGAAPGSRSPLVTKGELFARRRTWQSARSAIRRHACRVYARGDGPMACAVCGYDRYVEVCHRRAVSDFPATATVVEINDFANLVALCPNHHWELDHGVLVLDAALVA